MATVVDFAGHPPPPATIKAAGHVGVMRYISPDRTGGALPGKPATREQLDGYDAEGLAYGLVWQFGKERTPDVMRGADGGRADAAAAQAKLEEIGRPHHPVFFAVDFDITVGQWNATAVHYFRAAADVLGRDRVGIYGHSKVCHWAGPEDRVIAEVEPGRFLAWQTRSWSGGVEGRAYCVLFQRIVDTPSTPGPRIGGTVVDVNDVWAANWGQHPIERKAEPVAPIQKRPGWSGDPTWLPEAMRAFGVNVREEPGWQNRGNGDFKNVWGVFLHHTAANNTPTSLIRDGRAGLRGMLSQVHLLKDGSAVMVGQGVAWHAGRGSYPGLPTNNANFHTIGIEANQDGFGAWPPEQLDAYWRICAAICWVLDVNADRAIGHREYSSDGKIDPSPMNLEWARRNIQRYINNPPFAPNEQELEMQFWQEQVPSLVDPEKAFPRRDFIQLTDYHATKANEQSARALAELEIQREENEAQAAKLDALSGKLDRVLEMLGGRK